MSAATEQNTLNELERCADLMDDATAILLSLGMEATARRLVDITSSIDYEIDYVREVDVPDIEFTARTFQLRRVV